MQTFVVIIILLVLYLIAKKRGERERKDAHKKSLIFLIMLFGIYWLLSSLISFIFIEHQEIYSLIYVIILFLILYPISIAVFNKFQKEAKRKNLTNATKIYRNLKITYIMFFGLGVLWTGSLFIR